MALTPSLPTPVLLSPPFCHYWGWQAGRKEDRFYLYGRRSVGRPPPLLHAGQERRRRRLLMASSFARSSVGPPPSSPLFPSSCLSPCVPLSDPLQIHYFLRHRQPHRMRRPTTQVHSPPPSPCRLFFFPLSPPSLGRRPPPNRGHGSRLPSSSPSPARPPPLLHWRPDTEGEKEDEDEEEALPLHSLRLLAPFRPSLPPLGLLFQC